MASTGIILNMKGLLKRHLYCLLAIGLVLSLVKPSVSCDIFGIYKEFGDDHGLIDMKGRELIPTLFPAIWYRGHGLFEVYQRSPKNLYSCIPERLLINRNKVKLKVLVPPKSVFREVLWLGKKGADPTFVPDKIPDDALIKFCSNGNYGIGDSKGNILLPAEYYFIAGVRESKVIVQHKDGRQQIFDVATRQLTEINCGGKISVSNMCFNDGLVPFEQDKLHGYVDTMGKVAIPASFHWCFTFNRGLALVKVLSEDRKTAHGKIIDRKGNIVSPRELSLSEFYGDYAVASTGTGKLGLVNRKFQFVLPPEYTLLSPVLSEYYCLDDIWNRNNYPPLFYHAQKSECDPIVAISPKGETLFVIPKGANKNGLPTVFNGVLTYKIWNYPNLPETVYLNLKGEQVPEPFHNLSSETTRYRQIAPGIVLKTIEKSKYLFLEELEKHSCVRRR